MHYYLKVNRNEGYMVRNLKHWIDAIKLDRGASFRILCDNSDVKERILNNMAGIGQELFMQSDRLDRDIVDITKNNTSDDWKYASYSHLTTFKDALEHGYESFWNIDADDTCFCMEPERILEILKKAECVAGEKKFHGFSFDMSRSRRNGNFWSLGVTYIDNRVNWFSEMKKHCFDEYRQKETYRKLKLPECIDSYFTYLDECSVLNMGTFYVENCRFVHYSNDFVYRPWCSWFAVYKNGKILKPLLKDFYGLESVGLVPIYDDVIKIDVGLTDAEQVGWFLSRAAENDNNKKILCQSGREAGMDLGDI